MNEHIGSNFDDFIKEENIEISEEEIKNIFKDKCMEFLQMKLESMSEYYLLKEQVESVLKEAYNKRKIIPDWEIKRTKLPRKLKKKYKKENRICIDVKYIDYVPKCEIVIPIESEGTNEI